MKPRLKCAIRIKKKNNQNEKEKKLLGLLEIIDPTAKYTTKDDVTKIEEAIKLLQEIKDKKNDEAKVAFETMGSDAEKVLTKLIEDMKERREALPKEKTKDKINNTTEPPFYKTPLGVTLIIGGTLAVLAVVAYLIKINSSEEEE